MKYLTLGYRLPKYFSNKLFGERAKWGLKANKLDPCWIEWEKKYLDFYFENQKNSIGDVVNNAGYKVMREIELSGKRVLEIGPGEIRHVKYMQLQKGLPEEYVIVDIHPDMLSRSEEVLELHKINHSKVLLNKYEERLPFEDNGFDIIISFYSLEHLYPLIPYLSEIKRILKPGGILVGAIPAEGGLAWGLGRYLTSRRWLQKHTGINPDKIICWEHPNFADSILADLDKLFIKDSHTYWPLRLPLVDLNLVVRFKYIKVAE